MLILGSTYLLPHQGLVSGQVPKAQFETEKDPAGFLGTRPFWVPPTPDFFDYRTQPSFSLM